MKILIKTSIFFAAISALSLTAHAQTNNNAVGKKVKTPTNTSNSATTNATSNTNSNAANNTAVGPNNFNNTGTNQYNNGTGGTIPGATTNAVNTQPNTTTQTGNATTRSTVQPNAAVTQQIKLQGIKAEDHAKILQYARQAGAVTGNIDGDTLRISSNNFNRDRFSTLMSTALPDVTIQDQP